MFRLPWNASTMPHMVLDIIQECNISCKGCYKRRGQGYRPVEQVLEDLDFALSQSRFHTISLVGAEPTLHPQLPEIIAGIRKKGLRTSLVTNGLRLDQEMAVRLKAAGLDVALLHIDEGQTRPDMPVNPSFETISALRAEMAARVAAAGIDVGLSVTFHPEYVDRLPRLIDFILRSEHVNYLLCIPAVDIGGIVQSARRRRAEEPAAAEHSGLVTPWAGDRITNYDVMRVLREELGLEPAAYMPSRLGFNGDADFPSWMVYYAAVVGRPGRLRTVSIQGGWLDRLLLSLGRRITGRFYYYTTPRRSVIATEVFLNSLGRGRIWQGLSFVAAALRPGNRVRAKRLVFDNAPMVTPDGQVTCADPCPHRVVKNDRLVPVCMADYLNELPEPAPARAEVSCPERHAVDGLLPVTQAAATVLAQGDSR
jgi:hypothetical protein